MQDIRVPSIVAVTLLLTPLVFDSIKAEAQIQSLDRLSFDDALLGLLKEDDLQLSETAGLEANRELLKHESRSLLPMVQAGVKRHYNKGPAELGYGKDYTDLTVESSVNLFAFGRDRARIDSWKAGEDGIEWEMKAARLSAEKRSVYRLIQFISLGEQVRVVQAAYDSKQEFTARTRHYFDSGRLPSDNVEKQKVELASMAFDLNSKRMAMIRLGQEIEGKLHGHLPESDWPRLSVLNQDMSAELPKNQVDFKAKLANPALEKTQIDLNRSQFDYKATRADLWPTLDLGLSYQRPFAGEASGPVTDLTVGITVPILDSTRSFALVEARYKQIQANEFKLAHQQWAVKEELLGLYSKLSVESQTFLGRKRLMEQAAAILKRSRERFEVGRLSYIELADDESRLIQMELDSVKTLETMHLLLADICNLKGLFWRDCNRAALVAKNAQ